MFIFGILSTPLPYLVIAFVYLMGLGMGIFQKNHTIIGENEIVSNIINYEILSPEQENNEAQYHDFVADNYQYPNVADNFFIFCCSQQQAVDNQLPENQNIIYSYILTSNLFNRPPPVRS